MFSKELNELGTYWLDKLPNVSFEDTLRSCLCRQAYAKQPGHAQFYYPKHYGYGELWLRLAAALEDRLLCAQAAVRLDADKKQVTLEDGRQLKAQIIVSTVPWTSFQAIEGISEAAREGIGRLRHSATEIAYYPENMDTKAHWIYCPDPALSYHRILVRHNFCPGSKGYWTETNSERIHMERRQPAFAYCNAYALSLIHI